MRQRVAVARTLAMEPQVLLLDEPLSALDALTRANLQDEITNIRRQDDKTIVLITNDPDEAILLADRVIPLTRGPRATLGPSIAVNIPRPRSRLDVNHNPEFKKTRKEVIEYLLRSRDRQKTELTRKLVLPDLLPEDLDRPRMLFGKRRPRRRSEQKIETVEVIR
jgi:nitrate/nitrite transport system ATP-binding protein